MKVAATTVGRRGPENEGCNMERLRAAELALAKTSDLGADLIALPGGFFTAHSSRARDAIAKSLISKAKQIGIAIVFGVDEKVKEPSKDWEILVKGRMLPYWGYAWSPSENTIYCWPQRSSTSKNQWYASDERCKEMRLLGIKGETVGVLMCGEIFNQRIRHTLAIQSPRPRVIVDIAHTGSGFRVWQGMKKLAELGLATTCSVHAQREYAMKHCYVPKKGYKSTRIPDEYVFGPPRVELKLWSF